MKKLRIMVEVELDKFIQPEWVKGEIERHLSRQAGIKKVSTSLQKDEENIVDVVQ